METANFVIGGDPAKPMPLDYFVWTVERDGASPLVVDTGFGPDAAARRGRTILRPVVDGLRAVGVDPDAVEDVILTHLHYDHAGHMDLFPNARFHVQDAEMAYATGRRMGVAKDRAAFDCEPVTEAVKLNFAERMRFHSGDAELAPGIMLRALPGHTEGLQGVEVSTARGPVLLASDATHLYANLHTGVPFPIFSDVEAYGTAHARLRALAGGLDHIIPGHDPLVLQAYPAGTAPDTVRVDLPPVQPIEDLL